jgi:DNA (cytosine-5)-methyltransferase 1
VEATTPAPEKRREYGVKLVRGPFVRLDPHPEACSTVGEFLAMAKRLRAGGARLAADLFAGGGGLSLGLEQAGYRVVLAADHDAEAVETHRHHHAGLTLDCDLGDADQIAALAGMIKDSGVELVAGGPPCQPFSKAGRSKIRHRVRHGLRPEHDERRDLWRSFLEIIQLARPAAVIMENVPDMALDREMFILRTMVHELETLGYAVEERVVEALRYGVPQFRQSLFLVALEKGIAFDWPQPVPERVTVWNAIGDLPEVDGGWRPAGGADGWIPYSGPTTEFQRSMRRGVPEGATDRVYDHITRPVRADDRRAFDLMDADTLYSDLPAEFRRYRADIFDDKYKRLQRDHYSRSITAHIAKDGYWYIHPQQDRTLTVREAARLQTFPDDFRFAGPPSAAFRQIGNAVPPVLARHVSLAVRQSLDTAKPITYRTRDIAHALSSWFSDRGVLSLPWLRASTRWQVICGETILDKVQPDHIRLIWPLLQRWSEPADTAAAGSEVTEIGRWINRVGRARHILDVAERLRETPGAFDADDARIRGVDSSILDLATLVVPTHGEDESEEPVLATKGVLRVAARFAGELVDRRNRLTDGRLELARMIGDDAESRSAHLGLIELANSLCTTASPTCHDCPLRAACRQGRLLARAGGSV